MSRHFVNGKAKIHFTSEAEQHVNRFAKSAIPIAITVEEISKAIKNNQTLQKIIQIIRDKTWKHAMNSSDHELKSFVTAANHLITCNFGLYKFFGNSAPHLPEKRNLFSLCDH